MISLPFDSENTGYDEQGYPIYDRASNSEQLRTMLAKNFTDGVYPNPSTQFQVSTGTDMTVTVNPGACNIQGAFAYETVNRVLTVQASDTTYDRIDRVVLRLNNNTAYRNIDLYVVEGTPASVPVAPTLTRTSSIWEIGLANLFIAKNTTSISASRITDTRLDSAVCGIVSGTVQSVDTSTIFAQYQAALDEYLELVERAISETEAGYLQTQINGISDSLATAYDSTSTYAVGDYCIYDSKLYKCTTAMATSEAWTSEHWELTDCGSEIKTLNSNLDGVSSDLDGVSSDLDTFFTNHVGFANVNKTISELAVNSTITIPINRDRMPKFIMIDAYANTTPTFSMFKGSVSSSSASGGLMVQRYDGNISGLGTTTQCVNLNIGASLTLILTVKSVTKDNIVLNVNQAANSPLAMYINVTCFD